MEVGSSLLIHGKFHVACKEGSSSGESVAAFGESVVRENGGVDVVGVGFLVRRLPCRHVLVEFRTCRVEVPLSLAIFQVRIESPLGGTRGGGGTYCRVLMVSGTSIDNPLEIRMTQPMRFAAGSGCSRPAAPTCSRGIPGTMVLLEMPVDGARSAERRAATRSRRP